MSKLSFTEICYLRCRAVTTRSYPDVVRQERRAGQVADQSRQNVYDAKSQPAYQFLQVAHYCRLEKDGYCQIQQSAHNHTRRTAQTVFTGLN